MNTSRTDWGAGLVVLTGATMVHAAVADPPVIAYSGDGSDLQQVVDGAPSARDDYLCCQALSGDFQVDHGPPAAEAVGAARQASQRNFAGHHPA